MTRAWRLEVEYEGTRYAGWQRQPHARTVQGELARAFGELLGAEVEVGGSGRTDAGVHALAQVAHLRLKRGPRTPAPAQLLAGANKLLPHDINLRDLRPAAPDFHARHDARSRYYLYQISTRRTAFAKPFVWWVRDRLDLTVMDACARMLVGRHDFRSFCEAPEEHDSTLVHVDSFEVAREGALVLLRVGASHFLRKMVRRLVGALVEAGRGNLKERDFASLLRRISREPAAWTAPPSGLFLERVLYEGDPAPGPPRSALKLMLD